MSSLVIASQNWPHAAYGGAEFQAMGLAKNLAGQGVDVEVWTRNLPGLTIPERVRLRAFPVNRLLFAAAIARAARSEKPPVLFVPLVSSHSWALSLATLRETFLVVKCGASGRFGDVGTSVKRPWGRRKLRDVFTRADRIVVPDESMVDELVEAGCAREKIAIIPNGVDLSRFTAPRRRPARVLFAGRLVPQKGIDSLPGIWEAVADGASRLRIVGDGPMRATLEAWAKTRNDVEIAGFQTDMPAEYAAARVLLLPSRDEGLSNSLIEALAAGMKVVASDLPSHRNMARNVGDVCRAIPLEDGRSWSAAVREFLEASDFSPPEGIKKYSMESVASEYAKIFGFKEF